MKPRRILGGMLSATGLAATILIAAPATQANAALTCNVGALCLWDTLAGAGLWSDSTNPQEASSLGTYNDKPSAAWNRTGAYICLYEDEGWKGKHALRLPPHMPAPVDLNYTAPDGYNYNNSTSSFRMVVRNDSNLCPRA